jgi:hypothetical protein
MNIEHFLYEPKIEFLQHCGSSRKSRRKLVRKLKMMFKELFL